MPPVEYVHHTIETIIQLKLCIVRLRSLYVQLSNRLRSLLEAIAHQFGFSFDEATQVMAGPAHAGDYSMLVAGWIYRQRMRLATSNNHVDRLMAGTQLICARYSMNQLREWEAMIDSPDVSQQTLQGIANRTMRIPTAFQARRTSLGKEIEKTEKMIWRIENTPTGVRIRSLIAGDNDDSSGSDDEDIGEDNGEGN